MRPVEQPGAGGAGGHDQKAALFDLLAEAASALGAGRRGEIVDVLAQGERSVEEIAAEIAQSVANTSHHLQVLARSGLVASRRSGTHIYYRLAGPEIEDLWVALLRAAEAVRDDLNRVARSYLGDLTSIRVVGRFELLERLATEKITVLDVRPLAEYRAGHVPGALSAPLEGIAAAAGGISPDAPVVVYCRGPYCVFAPTAVRSLVSLGFDAARLEDGFPEWRRSGLPVAAGDDPGNVPRDHPPGSRSTPEPGG